MNFATFDFIRLKYLVEYLKNSLKSEMNTKIIRLYRSFRILLFLSYLSCFHLFLRFESKKSYK